MDDHQKWQDNTQEHQNYTEAEEERGRVHSLSSRRAEWRLNATQSKRVYQ